MDRPTWLVLMEASKIAARRLPPRRRRAVYNDLLVLRMALWSVMHDRPLCWACRRESYSGLFRPRRLLSVSRFSRRLRTFRFRRLLVLLHRVLTDRFAGTPLLFIDGKAVPVGEHTTDPDARDGVVTHGRFRKGFKLHALVNSLGFIEKFRVTPLNEGEAKVARKLVSVVENDAVVLADANYDSRKLYNAVGRCGGQLFTPIKGEAKAERTLRRMPPTRLAAIELWRDHPDLAAQAMDARGRIEQVFAHLCGFGGGLGPLQAWVRRLHRVRLWISAKIAIYHARIIARIIQMATG